MEKEQRVKVLKKKEISFSFKPAETIRPKIWPVKDFIDQHQCQGVYRVTCYYGKCYIEEASWSFLVKIKKHVANVHNEWTHTSALVEHSLNNMHHIGLNNTEILAKENHYFKRGVRKNLEIAKYLSNLYRYGRLEINNAWIPLNKKVSTNSH